MFYIYNDGSEAFPYATIQKAVDMSVGDGTDIIHVGVGTFTENILIENKHISIIGQGPESTIIDGGEIDLVFNLIGNPDDRNNIIISENNHGHNCSHTSTIRIKRCPRQKY